MSFKYGDNGAHFKSLSRKTFIVAHMKSDKNSSVKNEKESLREKFKP